jgi:hypothetical protein
MSDKQALKEARRRWGAQAVIERRRMPTIHNGHVLSGPYKVGRIELGMFFCVRGDGSSWEHAFAMATWYNHHNRTFTKENAQ